MSVRVGGAIVIGSVVFIVITLFEQVPVVGWLGALVSVAAWIWLASEIRRAGGAFTDAAIAGAITGFVGAVSAWMLQVGNLFGPDTPGLARFGAGFGTIGATIFLVIWPLIGALVCGGAAALRARRYAPGP
ncbi:MAG TPA: hypothetical protein VL493_05290 [Candidatus Saccharimonadales bacterium]|nr:hypothetical protein [Candidatus Saccharimonadales bacterium]